MIWHYIFVLSEKRLEHGGPFTGVLKELWI
jgi:hypothetical protein